MVLRPSGLRPGGDYAVEAKQQEKITHPSSRQRGRYTLTNSQLSKENFKEKVESITGPGCGLTPGETGRLTVGCKITLTLTLKENMKQKGRTIISLFQPG
jgi:hypothetical protein